MVAQPQVATQMVYNVPQVVPQYYHHYPAVQTAYTYSVPHVYNSVHQVYNTLPLVHHQQYAYTYPYVMPVVQQAEQKETEAVEMA